MHGDGKELDDSLSRQGTTANLMRIDGRFVDCPVCSVYFTTPSTTLASTIGTSLVCLAGECASRGSLANAPEQGMSAMMSYSRR